MTLGPGKYREGSSPGTRRMTLGKCTILDCPYPAIVQFSLPGRTPIDLCYPHWQQFSAGFEGEDPITPEETERERERLIAFVEDQE